MVEVLFWIINLCNQDWPALEPPRLPLWPPRPLETGLSSSDSPLDSVDDSETLADPELVVLDGFDFAGLLVLLWLFWPLPLPAPLERPEIKSYRKFKIYFKLIHLNWLVHTNHLCITKISMDWDMFASGLFGTNCYTSWWWRFIFKVYAQLAQCEFIERHLFGI